MLTKPLNKANIWVHIGYFTNLCLFKLQSALLDELM